MDNKKTPLISVIVPIYNVEEYLKRCVESIQQQSYKNLEIILVDDGSPDKCGEMCDMFCEGDKRVRVIHQLNGGLSAARNTGINNAKGEYLIFIDSDDYISYDMIEKLYEALERHAAEIAVCGYDLVYEGGNVEKTTFNQESEVQVLTGTEATKRLMNDLEPTMVVAWNKLTKISLWRTMRFPVGKQHEDDFTTYRLLYQADKVVLINEQLYHYFQRANSIIGRGFSEKSLHKVEAYNESRSYFRNKDKGLFQRASNLVLVMNKRCCIEAMKSNLENKHEVVKNLRKEGRRFYFKNVMNIKRNLKYHIKLIAFFFFAIGD